MTVFESYTTCGRDSDVADVGETGKTAKHSRGGNGCRRGRSTLILGNTQGLQFTGTDEEDLIYGKWCVCCDGELGGAPMKIECIWVARAKVHHVRQTVCRHRERASCIINYCMDADQPNG